MRNERVIHGLAGRSSGSGIRRIERPRQQQLPLPWHLVKPQDRHDFAHPVEAELARIFTFYRVRWLYEPTSFVLARDTDGRPSESFTPDFYLPDFRLYIELTTMRQALVTRKNRKLRRVRELYPGVNIKLMYRREVDALLKGFTRGGRVSAEGRPGVVIASSQKVDQRVAEVAADVIAWRDECGASEDEAPLQMIGISPGGLHFKRQLASVLRSNGQRVELDRTMLTRYRSSSTDARVRIARAPRKPFAGRDVLIVADVVSSGLSVSYLVGWLRRHGARRIEICTLMNRESVRLVDLPVRFSAFTAPAESVVGYGLGGLPALRSLPYLATLAIAGDSADVLPAESLAAD